LPRGAANAETEAIAAMEKNSREPSQWRRVGRVGSKFDGASMTAGVICVVLSATKALRSSNNGRHTEAPSHRRCWQRADIIDSSITSSARVSRSVQAVPTSRATRAASSPPRQPPTLILALTVRKPPQTRRKGPWSFQLTHVNVVTASFRPLTHGALRDGCPAELRPCGN
jgi:hypothetical protein